MTQGENDACTEENLFCTPFSAQFRFCGEGRGLPRGHAPCRKPLVGCGKRRRPPVRPRAAVARLMRTSAQAWRIHAAEHRVSACVSCRIGFSAAVTSARPKLPAWGEEALSNVQRISRQALRATLPRIRNAPCRCSRRSRFVRARRRNCAGGGGRGTASARLMRPRAALRKPHHPCRTPGWLWYAEGDTPYTRAKARRNTCTLL